MAREARSAVAPEGRVVEELPARRVVVERAGLAVRRFVGGASACDATDERGRGHQHGDQGS